MKQKGQSVGQIDIINSQPSNIQVRAYNLMTEVKSLQNIMTIFNPDLLN